jgi:hypothetical protein
MVRFLAVQQRVLRSRPDFGTLRAARRVLLQSGIPQSEAPVAALRARSERDVAARLFPYLVTPSGRKIAQKTKDLLNCGRAPEEQVRDVLERLSEQSDTRILRRLATPEMYELFHDVLASPVLAWHCAATSHAPIRLVSCPLAMPLPR